MYNLTVAEAHTFYVGSGQWLVHNQNLPTASQLREWAKSQGYEKLKTTDNGIEIWGDKKTGDWRLKLKPPSEYADIDPGSKQFRYSARTPSGEYFDPITGKIGTRSTMGHLPFNPCDF